MTIHVMQIQPVPPNTGGSLGSVTYDDASGKLTFTGIGTSIFRHPRAEMGDDRKLGEALVKGGWSNGQLYLTKTSS